MIFVEVGQGVADDDGAAARRAEEVGEVDVSPTAGFGRVGLSRDAGFVDSGRSRWRAGRRVIEMAGQASRHHRLWIGYRPKYQDLGSDTTQPPHEARHAVDPRRAE